MIPEILFELCSGQKCGLRTDRRIDRQVQNNIPRLLEGGHKKDKTVLSHKTIFSVTLRLTKLYVKHVHVMHLEIKLVILGTGDVCRGMGRYMTAGFHCMYMTKKIYKSHLVQSDLYPLYNIPF